MKQKIAAALLAAVLLLLAGCRQTTMPEEQPMETAVQAQTETAEPVQDMDAAPEKAADTQEDAAGVEKAAFLDEPQIVQEDLDEVVSCTFRLPHVTLASTEASDQVNAGFDRLLESLREYAANSVYVTAQEKQKIGFLDGDYTIQAADGVLTVTYTVSERYADDGDAVSQVQVYSFDLDSGNLIEE